MQTDKNTVIGMILLAILFFAYFYFSNQQNAAYQAKEKHDLDSIALVKQNLLKLQDSSAINREFLKKDSIEKLSAAGDFTTAGIGKEEFTTIENDVIKVTFTNKGGAVKQVELKKYNSSFDGKPVVLGGTPNDKLSYQINTGNNSSNFVSNLYFPTPVIQTASDNTQTISFTIASKNGQSLTHQYVIKPNSYAIDWNINMNGADKLLSNGNLNFDWKWQTLQNEKSNLYERQMSNICFSEDNQFDYISRNKEHTFEKPAQGLRLYNSFLILH